jgi:hypothetical protein
MAKVTDAIKAAITTAVITAINQDLDKPLSTATPYADTGKISLTRDLGMGSTMVTALAIPLNKISRQYGGRGLGVDDIQKAKTVKDCIDIVIATIPGNAPMAQS